MQIGVYGLGRFGRFWAELLAQKFPVKGYSRTQKETAPVNVAVVSEDEVLQSDVLFLCVSISAMEEVLKRIRTKLAPGTLVVDTCSVKSHPIALMRRLLPPTVKILGTHPMFGPDSGARGVVHLPIVLCAVPGWQDAAGEWARHFVDFSLDVQFKTPEEHDREAAYTQGITHLLGRVLADFGIRPSPIATVGYQKLLEVMEQTCNDPWQLFLDLQKYNPFTEEMRRKLKESIETIMTAIPRSSSIDSAESDG